MISNQESLKLRKFMAIYDMVLPKDNILRYFNELVDFSFVLEELKHKKCETCPFREGCYTEDIKSKFDRKVPRT